MRLSNIKVGLAFTGSFCTTAAIVKEMENLLSEGADIYPIVSYAVKNTDTRFGEARDLMNLLKETCQKPVMDSIVNVEPIGPKGLLDILVVAPCTGNTLSKISNGITDTPVTMAVKAHLRNQKPVVICISTNDALGANAGNIGKLLNTKNIYFVPFYQDNFDLKPNSLIGDTNLIIPTILEALQGKQLQPITLQ
jgi:dipicolinate synthase subunit B